MYKHEVAPLCQNQSNCRVNLCQYRHSFISNVCEFRTKSNSDVEFHERNYHTLAENTDNEMGHTYKCNECEFESKSIAGVRIHASAKHKNLDVLNYVDDDDYDDDEVEEEEEDGDGDDGPTNTFKRCLYGLCSFRQILFKTTEDLKTQLEVEHDIIEGQ